MEGREVTSEPSAAWEMQPCILFLLLVLELGLWGNCGKALPCTLPHLPAGMFPGGRELRKDERGAPGMAGMQTNNEPGKRWARILCADGESVKYGNKITQPSSLLGRRWLIRCLPACGSYNHRQSSPLDCEPQPQARLHVLEHRGSPGSLLKGHPRGGHICMQQLISVPVQPRLHG